MKSIIVIALLFLSLAIASLQFANKKFSQDDNEIDEVLTKLHEVKNIVKPGSGIFLSCNNTPVKIGAQARLALAPSYLEMDDRSLYDTAMIITTTNVDCLLINRKIIWKSVDSHYEYLLTCTPPHEPGK